MNFSPRVKVEQTKLVGASPEKVYAILVQPEHHKHILPDAFTSFSVEADGSQLGTLQLGLLKKTLHVRPEQTEHNRVYSELDLQTNVLTEFRLEPHADGTLVTIATDYKAKGLTSVFEAIIAPPLLRQLYEEELTKLCRYALIASV